ncbi:MAG TPA: FAD-binding oxidoreductase [Rhizomicrobium sp.]|jgi:gamma-glutamylputrescine oxidase
MKSGATQGYYAATAGTPPARPALSGNLIADVCIVGGGFTGLSAAVHLAEAGAKVVLVEAETIGFAASGRNGGQIHTGQRKEQAELETWLGKQHAHDLWALSEEAKQTVRDLAARYAIDCDLKPGLILAAHNDAALKGLAEDAEHLAREYGYSLLRMLDRAESEAQIGSKLYPGARLDMGGGHLHPLKFARGLAQAAEKGGAQLFERSRAHAVTPGSNNAVVTCDGGTVTAQHVLLACDAFSGKIAPQLAKYIAHVESFIVGTAPLSAEMNAQVLPSDCAVADTRHVLDYYRKSADGRMLFAGREAYWNPPEDIAGLVRPRMLTVYPQLANVPIEYAWRGTVGITRTRMPHFGRLSERVLFAHGYSGQGVAMANLGGKLMAEAALGRPERFDVVARVPAKAFPGGPLLRKPLVTASLLTFKVLDAL